MIRLAVGHADPNVRMLKDRQYLSIEVGREQELMGAAVADLAATQDF